MTMFADTCHTCRNGRRTACPSCVGLGLQQAGAGKTNEWDLCVVCEGRGLIHCPDCIGGVYGQWHFERLETRVPLSA